MIRLRTLGESVIEVGAVRVAPDADVLFAALVYLAAERGRPQGRELLTTLFWPHLPHDRARHCLRQAVYKMRQIGVQLRCTHAHVELPAELVAGSFAAERSQARLEEERSAGRLLLGTFLPGYAPTFSSEFAEWLERERDHVHSQVRRALLGAMQARKARGEWAEVESLARECLALDALNEEATLALAESAALSGGKTEAIAILDQYIQELGPLAGDIRMPAAVLRRRIAERFPLRRYLAPSERCFVGRETQMAALSTALQRARNAEGGAILLWGPPGIGKTRLATEVRKVATLQGVRVVRVGCEETDTGRPMGVWIDAVPQLLSLPGALGCAPESLTYLKRLTQHDPNVATPSPEVRDAGFLAASIRRAIVDLVDAVTGEHPLLFVLEDAHWADAASWHVLRELADGSTTKRLLLLLTSRTPHPTPRQPARISARLEVLAVPPLDPRAGEALLRAAVPEGRSAELTADTVAWCLSVGEGNPLFLHELASHWGETGRTREVPASLQQLIDVRIAALRPTALYVLEACAVLARNATAERLEALLELRVHELLACLAELSDARLVTEDEGRIAPLHEVVAQRTMLAIGGPALRLLHRGAAMVLEREIRAGEGTGILWDCARHWQAAGSDQRALNIVLWTAVQMLELGAPTDAAGLLEHALSRSTSDRERLAVAEGLTFALRSCGRWLQLRENVARTVRYRGVIAGRPTELPDDVLGRIEAESLLGSDGEAVMREAQLCAVNLRWPSAARLRAANWALIYADNCCHAEIAHDVYERTADIARDASDTVDLLRREMIYHATVGDGQEAIRPARELDALARGSHSALEKARMLRHSACTYRLAGLYDDAERNLLEAHTIALAHGLRSAALSASDYLATLEFERGNLAEAKRWVSRSRRFLVDVESADLELSTDEMEARLAIYTGTCTESLPLLNRSVAEIERSTSLRGRVHVLATHAQLRLHMSPAPLPAELIEQLLHLHSRRRHYAAHDRFVALLYRALCRNGQDCIAASHVQEYLGHARRERTPLPWYFVESVPVEFLKS